MSFKQQIYFTLLGTQMFSVRTRERKREIERERERKI